MKATLPSAHAFLVWCGREGFLSFLDMIERTDRDIEAYARMQPLRFRSAMAPRDYNGARIYRRKPVKMIAVEPQPQEQDDISDQTRP